VCAALEQAGVEDESCREAAEQVTGRQGDRGGEKFAIRNLKVERISEARKNLWGIEGGER